MCSSGAQVVTGSVGGKYRVIYQYTMVIDWSEAYDGWEVVQENGSGTRSVSVKFRNIADGTIVILGAHLEGCELLLG